MYEEEILEATLPIRFGQPYDTVRDASIAFARKWCNTVGHGLHEACRLEFLSPDSYYLRCRPDHFNVPVVSFSFGSFRNYGVFESHYDMVGGQKPIVMDFEHDVKRMDLFCIFQTIVPDPPPPPQPQQRGNYRQQRGANSGIMISRLHYKYQSIHSIVVDYGGDYGEAREEYVSPATVLYFRLKHPPTIEGGWPHGLPQNRQFNVPPTMNAYESCMANRRAVRYDRVRELVDCNWEKIGKCNVLKVVLRPFNPQNEHDRRQRGGMGDNEIDWHESVNEILSRVKTRASCRVYFTGIRTMQGKPTGITVSRIGVVLGKRGLTWKFLPFQISENYLTSFKCYYLLKALISTRTYTIEDQVTPPFLAYVRQCASQNERAAEIALSQLLAAADENRYFSLMTAFGKIFEVYANEAAVVASTAAGQNNGPASKNPKKSNNAAVTFEDEPVSQWSQWILGWGSLGPLDPGLGVLR